MLTAVSLCLRRYSLHLSPRGIVESWNRGWCWWCVCFIALGPCVFIYGSSFFTQWHGQDWTKYVYWIKEVLTHIGESFSWQLTQEGNNHACSHRYVIFKRGEQSTPLPVALAVPLTVLYQSCTSLSYAYITYQWVWMNEWMNCFLPSSEFPPYTRAPLPSFWWDWCFRISRHTWAGLHDLVHSRRRRRIIITS